jgi:iron complex transport system substrate-binding protein
MARHIIRQGLLLALSFTALSCGSVRDDQSGGEVLRFVDDLGKFVELDGRPDRIVSLAPNITEMIFFFGEGEKLVGITNQCDWPPGARSLTKVGDFSNPSIERIINLSPDLVVTTSHEQDRWIGKIVSLGIPVYTIYPRDCDGLISSMMNLLDVLGKTKNGLDSIQVFSDRLHKIDVQFGDDKTNNPRVFIEISNSPLMTAGNSSFVSDLIERAGGGNIAVGLERDYCIINPERVISGNPEVIFIFHGLSSRKELLRRIGWGSIEAVKTGRVYDDVNPDLVLRPGPRIVMGIQAVKERLYGTN